MMNKRLLNAGVWLLLIAGSILFLLGASGWGLPELRRQAQSENLANGVADTAPGASVMPPSYEHALIASLVLIAIVILLLAALSEGRGKGLYTVVLGADCRLSTGKTLAALWTWVIVLALLFMVALLLASAIWSPHNYSLSAFEFPEAYLVLLGGPFAAVVVAKAATTDGIDNKRVQRAKGEPKPSDLVTNDNGKVDLVDTQYVLFNLVLVSWLIVTFIREPSALPAVPGSLLALTSVTAATYATAKGVFKNPPVITSVVPVEETRVSDRIVYTPLTTGKIETESLVEIQGANLVPAGTVDKAKDAKNWSVRFRSDQLDVQPTAECVAAGTGTVVVKTPDTAGCYDLSVITPADPAVESGAVRVTVYAR